MNKLLLWIAICVSLSACTNWPREGYFENTTLETEKRIQFKKHYEYLNLHLSVANLRGAETCTPAYVNVVNNINSRVEKAIAVEDSQDINVEMAILESNITDLIVNLNRVSANTNCAQPPRLLTSTFVHPLTYQLDLLLYCAPQFQEGQAVMTELYKVCLRQVSFLLLDNPDVVIEYTKYKLFEPVKNADLEDSDINYNQEIVIHDVVTITDVNRDLAVNADSNDDYNDVMRKYLVFDQIPSVDVEQLSPIELNITQVHTPVQVQEFQVVNKDSALFQPDSDVNYAIDLKDVELLNLRTDAIFNYVSSLISDDQKNSIIYEDLKFNDKPPSDPVITTLMWKLKSNKVVDHKVKNWRFLLSEGEQFSDAALPKGIAL
ncbi:hypothetical protein HWV00_09295 [Moritella sp. 24]|uniref:hypothetical protein n=1 Tax=Moritella sp. 24 TaxID=2746230 RepID=UPI001BABF493|nr:hypothetical protein [Moritella sp. 24]QUM76400.1 hypothetical protein HWV00_09295 [Moritella sp. 24]